MEVEGGDGGCRSIGQWPQHAPGSTAGLPGSFASRTNSEWTGRCARFDGPSGADAGSRLGLALEAALGKLPAPAGPLTRTAALRRGTPNPLANASGKTRIPFGLQLPETRQTRGGRVSPSCDA